MGMINLEEERRKRTEKKREELQRISERLMDLYDMLGYAKTKDGESLAERAMVDEDAEKMYDKLISRHQKEYQEMEELEMRWGQLAKEIGMWR